MVGADNARTWIGKVHIHVEQGGGNKFYITHGYSRSYLRVRGERELAVAGSGGREKRSD